jgi:hypothetical protein
VAEIIPEEPGQVMLPRDIYRNGGLNAFAKALLPKTVTENPPFFNNPIE